jgi:hypothetical protein
MSESALVDDVSLPGTCEHCGAEDVLIYRDNSRCEECDGDSVYCGICKKEWHRDGLCRHIFETEGFEFCGAGVGIDKSVKPSLFKLFDLMPDGFVPDLRIAIATGRFHTFSIMAMIGGGGRIETYGMPKREGFDDFSGWGKHLINIGQGESAEETADGYHWLVSLYDDKTPEANSATIAWIDEYLAAKSESGGEEA